MMRTVNDIEFSRIISGHLKSHIGSIVSLRQNLRELLPEIGTEGMGPPANSAASSLLRLYLDA
jgi:hypothetical protein